MRSLRLEHSPLGLLNPVWGTHSAPCCGDALCAVFVLEGRWEGLSFRLCELLRATKSCAYWVFTPQRFPPSAPHISYQWKVKTFFGHLAETMWGLTEAQNFCVCILEGLCNGYLGRSSLESMVLLHMGVKTAGPMGLLEARPRACGWTD